MKVFLSWSRSRSLAVAEALNEFLPHVMQEVEPFFSRDMPMGSRWSSQLGKALDSHSVGILCVSPENAREPWLLFEAGALSKSLESGAVCPYLYEIKPEALPSPLGQFQAAMATEGDTRKLCEMLNSRLLRPLKPGAFEESFATWWPRLAGRLAKVPLDASTLGGGRSDREVLEEILDRVRGLTSAVTRPGELATYLSTIPQDELEELLNGRLRPDVYRRVVRSPLRRMSYVEWMKMEEERKNSQNGAALMGEAKPGG